MVLHELHVSSGMGAVGDRSSAFHPKLGTDSSAMHGVHHYQKGLGFRVLGCIALHAWMRKKKLFEQPRCLGVSVPETL